MNEIPNNIFPNQSDKKKKDYPESDNGLSSGELNTRSQEMPYEQAEKERGIPPQERCGEVISLIEEYRKTGDTAGLIINAFDEELRNIQLPKKYNNENLYSYIRDSHDFQWDDIAIETFANELSLSGEKFESSRWALDFFKHTLAEDEIYMMPPLADVYSEFIANVTKTIHQKKEQLGGDANYFLMQYAQAIIEKDGFIENYNQNDIDIELVAKDRYMDVDRLLISGTEDVNKVKETKDYIAGIDTYIKEALDYEGMPDFPDEAFKKKMIGNVQELLIENGYDKEHIESREPEELISLCIKHSIKNNDVLGLVYAYSDEIMDIRTESEIYARQYFKKLEIQDLSIGEAKNLTERDMRDYQLLLHNALREGVEKDFSISLAELDVPTQFRFLLFLKNKSIAEANEVMKFSSKHKERGLRTFLALEHGGDEMSDNILILGEKLPQLAAEKLFTTYGDMIDATDEVSDLLRENLGEKATPEVIQQAREGLLIRGRNLLKKYAEQVESCHGISCDEIGAELQERLRLAKRSVFAFSSACRTLVDNDQFSFEDFKSAQLVYERAPLPDAIRQQIIEMHHENTKQYPEKLREYWRGTLREGIENSNDKQMFVATKFENDVTAVMRVIEQDDGSWYGASFNVNPVVQGSRIGTELLKEVIHNMAKDKPFIAECYAENPMLDTYVNKFGFEITKTIKNYHDTGSIVLEITLYPRSSDSDSIEHQK